MSDRSLSSHLQLIQVLYSPAPSATIAHNVITEFMIMHLPEQPNEPPPKSSGSSGPLLVVSGSTPSGVVDPKKLKLPSKVEKMVKDQIKSSAQKELSLHFPFVAHAVIARHVLLLDDLFDLAMKDRNAKAMMGNDERERRAAGGVQLPYYIWNYIDSLVKLYQRNPANEIVTGVPFL